MSFWSIRSLDLDDEINSDIWDGSPTIADQVRAGRPSQAAGLLQGLHGGLPWVPDLVDRRWRDAGAVHVVGSTYSPFFGDVTRPRSMSIDSYRRSRMAREFQETFIPRVVTGDSSYYEPVARLIEAATGHPDRFVVTDLVRGCFVTLADRRGGDTAVRADPGLFSAYARAGWDWTWRRLVESEASTIIALGRVAEEELLGLLAHQGLRVGAPDGRHAGTTTGHGIDIGVPPERGLSTPSLRWREASGVLEGRSRVWRILRVVHPSRRNVWDPGYRDAISVLESMIAGSPAATSDAPASHGVGPGSVQRP